MAEEQAEIVLLKDALVQAQHTVGFLHGCLTDPTYSYAYPEQTERRLAQWHELAPMPEHVCVHSNYHESCASCVEREVHRAEVGQAHQVLESPLIS